MFSFSLELVIQTWPKEALEVFYTNKKSPEFLSKWGNNLDQKWDNMVLMIIIL